MELTQTVQCTCRVSATYEESGELSVKVFAQAEYAKGRTTTIEAKSVSDVLRKRLADVCQEILDQSSDGLGPLVAQAIHKSTEVAAARGELS